MRNTFCALGLGLALLVGGCAQGGDVNSSPSPAATSAHTDVHPNDVASVDLAADQGADSPDRTMDGKSPSDPFRAMDESVDNTTEGSDESAERSTEGSRTNTARANMGDDEVASLNEAKTGHNTGSPEQQVAMKALEGNLVEQILAGLAMERSDNREVEETARQIAGDHTKAEAQLRKAMASLPNEAELSPEHQKLQQKLEGLQGKQFDKAYMAAMVTEHQKDLKFYREQATKAPTEKLRTYFGQNISALEKHLEHCQQLKSKLS